MADWNQPEVRQLIDKRKAEIWNITVWKMDGQSMLFGITSPKTLTIDIIQLTRGNNVTISFSTLHELMV